MPVFDSEVKYLRVSISVLDRKSIFSRGKGLDSYVFILKWRKDKDKIFILHPDPPIQDWWAVTTFTGKHWFCVLWWECCFCLEQAVHSLHDIYWKHSLSRAIDIGQDQESTVAMLFILFFCFGFDLCTECNFHLMLCVSEKVWVDICAHAHVLIKSFCLLHELLNLFYFLLGLSNFDCSRILYLTYFLYFRLPFTKGHFPKMAECAHFHYENVEFGSIQVYLRFFLHTKARRIYVLPVYLIGDT